MTDDYSDNIDWDKVYQAFHDPRRVADNIAVILGKIDGPVVFCGFPEVASELSESFEIVHVDSSQAVVSNSEARYPGVATIVLSEIEKFLHVSDAKHVVISGRLSAFWQTPEDFRRVADALMAYPRETVLIDYFDQEQIYPGLVTNFSSPLGEGVWKYTDVEESLSQEPPISNVGVRVTYSLGIVNFSYLAKRAYFNRELLRQWHDRTFKGYATSLLEGLIPKDPSFSVKMVPYTTAQSVSFPMRQQQ